MELHSEVVEIKHLYVSNAWFYSVKFFFASNTFFKKNSKFVWMCIISFRCSETSSSWQSAVCFRYRGMCDSLA